MFLPLTFISNAFVPTQGMPGWLRAVADWNPFSALAAASRHLFGNPDPAATVQAWPMPHPELAVVLWSAALLAVFAPWPSTSTAASPSAEPRRWRGLHGGRAAIERPRPALQCDVVRYIPLYLDLTLRHFGRRS